MLHDRLAGESTERLPRYWVGALLAMPAICLALTFVLPLLPDGSPPLGPCHGSSLVHVRLLGEPADVWGAAPAHELAPMIYEILAAPYSDSIDHAWELVPGTVVRCEERLLPGESRRVAVALAERPSSPR